MVDLSAAHKRAFDAMVSFSESRENYSIRISVQIFFTKGQDENNQKCRSIKNYTIESFETHNGANLALSLKILDLYIHNKKCTYLWAD